MLPEDLTEQRHCSDILKRHTHHKKVITEPKTRYQKPPEERIPPIPMSQASNPKSRSVHYREEQRWCMPPNLAQEGEVGREKSTPRHRDGDIINA